MSFPTLPLPNSPMEGGIEDHSYKGESDGVTILTRPKLTKMVRVFKPSWDAMPKTDFQNLLTFYKSVYGGALQFEWTHPNEGADANKVFIMRFDGNLEWSLTNLGYYKVSFTLKGYEKVETT